MHRPRGESGTKPWRALPLVFVLGACAGRSTPTLDARNAGSCEVRISIVASSDAEGAISRTEVRVDGDLVATSETGSIDVPALELAGGQHRLELRILLDAPADESGAAVVWSTSELFRVEALAEPESGGGAPASVVTEVLLLPGARPVARRLEARFHGARAAFESGTVPRIEAVTSVLDQAVALGRDGSGDPVVDADQRIERMIAAVDELDAGVATRAPRETSSC
ncbi:MAG: hypothetical protein U0414_20540 [Polyangiaceae bacterium]